MVPRTPNEPDDARETTAARVLVVGPDDARVAALAGRLAALGFACDASLASPAALRGGLLRRPDVIVAIEVAGLWQPTRGLLEIDLAQLQDAAPPVLVASEGVSAAERADALASPTSGVWDWIDLSCADREFAARLMRLARLRRMGAELDELRHRCAEMETIDRLTGLPNHRAFQDYLTAEFRRAERYGSPLSLVIFDLDRFRSLNDAHGHLWGDRLIQSIAMGLRGIVRGADMASRYGGEEFALLLPEAGAAAAFTVASRVRAMVEEISARQARTPAASAAAEGPSRVTISAGIATYPDEGTATRGLLLAGAESALQRAKDEGRNRIVAHAAGPASRATAPARPAAASPGSGGPTGWSG